MTERYTQYPRPVLWLIPGSEPVDAATTSGGPTPSGADVVEPFYLSTLPVTNRQLEAALPGWQRSPFAGGDEDPAVGVPYEAASEYCAWYARVARKPMRLPSEREWLHAARCGAALPWPASLGAAEVGPRVWHAGNSDAQRVPELTGQGSNPFGIFAMMGGVQEWVAEGKLCGGSWRMSLAEILATVWRPPAGGQAPADAGFRIAKSLRG